MFYMFEEEETPASEATDRGHGRTNKEFDMSQSIDRESILAGYLARNAQDVEKAASQRVYYFKLAREYGFTNQWIADQIGVTEAAVRQMVKRHGGA